MCGCVYACVNIYIFVIKIFFVVGVKSVLQFICSVSENKVPNNKYLDHYDERKCNTLLLPNFNLLVCIDMFFPGFMSTVLIVCASPMSHIKIGKTVYTEDWMEQSPLCLAHIVCLNKLP